MVVGPSPRGAPRATKVSLPRSASCAHPTSAFWLEPARSDALDTNLARYLRSGHLRETLNVLRLPVSLSAFLRGRQGREAPPEFLPRISHVRPATPSEWDEAWRHCEYATYFHSREWADIWQVYSEGRLRSRPRFISFRDGATALLPLMMRKTHKNLIRTYVSSPAGTFGGWISRERLSPAHARLLAAYLLHRCGNIHWRVNPYDELLRGVDVGPHEQDCTHALDLSAGFDTLAAEWASNHAAAMRNVRRARDAGVSIRRATSIEEWRRYYQVYEASLRRWGDRAHQRYKSELFLDMARRHSSHVRLWLAVYRGVIVAGALCLYAKRHVAYWHGAALEEYFQFRPVNLLMFEIARDACSGGYSWFDLGPSAGLEGVIRFKRSLGARELSCPYVKIESPYKRYVSQWDDRARYYTSRLSEGSPFIALRRRLFRR